MTNIPSLLRKIGRSVLHPTLARNKLRHVLYRTDLGLYLGRGWSFLPNTVFFLPTFRCPLRCVMCGVNIQFFDAEGGPKYPSMTWEETVRVVDAFCTHRPNVILSGGEPLLYEHTPAIFERIIRRNRCYAMMVTNGLALEKSAEMLVEQGVSAVYVSLDGLGEVHDKVRGTSGVFRHLTEGLEALKTAKAKFHSRLPELGSILTITRHNFHTVAETYRYLVDQGVQWTEVHHLASYQGREPGLSEKELGPFWHLEPFMGDTQGDWIPTEEETAEVFAQTEKVKALGRKAGRTVHIQPDLTLPEIRRFYHRSEPVREGCGLCRIPWKVPCVFPDGSVHIFQYCFTQSAGNLREWSLPEIWNGPLYRQVRRQILSGKVPEVCRTCPNTYQR